MFLSSSGKLSRLTLAQVTALVTITSLALEFAQLLPRPGILSNIRYTFDWLDIASTLVSLSVAFIVAALMLKRVQRHHPTSRQRHLA